MGDRPFDLTNVRFAETLYRNSPYRRSLLGDEASLRKITASDLRAAWRKQFSGANLVVAISGDFDSDEVIALARRSLGSIPKGSPNEIGGAATSRRAAAGVRRGRIRSRSVQHGLARLLRARPGHPALKAGVALIGDSSLQVRLRARRGVSLVVLHERPRGQARSRTRWA